MTSSGDISSPFNLHLYHDSGHINYDNPICMFASFVIWRCLYQVLRFFLYNKSPEYSSRIISALHGVAAAFLGINQCFLYDWPFDYPEWKTSYIETFIMSMSFGYFVHDFIWMLKYDRKDTVMLFHHVVCIAALCRMNYKGYSGAQATCALGSMELTNPFLQARWFLRTEGMYKTPVYVSTEITFFLIFIFIRIILGTYFLNVILRQPKNEWDFTIMSISIYVISWMFVGSMVKYILRKYIGQSTSSNSQNDNDKSN